MTHHGTCYISTPPYYLKKCNGSLFEMHTVFRVSYLNIFTRRFACNADDSRTSFSKLPIPLNEKPYLWLATLPHPQHKGLILFKEKPYLWLVTHPWLATNQPIPNLGVRVKIDGAYGVGRVWWHPDKIPFQVKSPRVTRPLQSNSKMGN